MQFNIVLSLLFFSFGAFAKEPASPLFNLQFWVRSLGGEILTDNPIGSGKSFRIKSCAGIDLNLTKAWDISTGSKSVVVGVLDDGFELNHENYKKNLGQGFNSVDPKSPPDSCLTDIDRDGKASHDCGFWHGNMALGIIGAAPTSKYGIAGINWSVTLMPLKKNDQQGVGAKRPNEAEHIAAAIRYAVDHKARIINWSGFTENLSKSDESKIRKAFQYAEKKDVLIVMGAGNGFIDMDKAREKLPFPQNEDFKNVIYVANVNACGTLVDYENHPETRDKENRTGGSNFGDRAFIAAPGEFAITTMNVENGKARYFLGGGTSNAAPMVSGVAALMLSVNPTLSFGEIKAILCSTSKQITSLKSKVRCGGIPDAYAALKAAKASRH